MVEEAAGARAAVRPEGAWHPGAEGEGDWPWAFAAQPLLQQQPAAAWRPAVVLQGWAPPSVMLARRAAAPVVMQRGRARMGACCPPRQH